MKKTRIGMLVVVVAVASAITSFGASLNWSGTKATAAVPAGTFAGGTYSQLFYWDAATSTNAITTNDTVTVMTLPDNCIVWGATLDVIEPFSDNTTNATLPGHTIDVGYNGSAAALFDDVSLTNAVVSAIALAPYNQVTRVITNAVYGGGTITGNVTVVESASVPYFTTSNGVPVTIAITAASRGNNPKKGKLQIRVLYNWLGGK